MFFIWSVGSLHKGEGFSPCLFPPDKIYPAFFSCKQAQQMKRFQVFSRIEINHIWSFLVVKWTWRAPLQDRKKFESMIIICLTSLSFFLLALWGRHTVRVFFFVFFVFSEVDLPLKKDGFTSESTTLEALLRGEGIEKKTDTKEEDTIQEIQVKASPMPWHQGWILQFISKSSSLLSCGRTVYLLIVVSFCCQNIIKPLCYTVMLKMMSVSHTLLLSQDLCCLTVFCTGPVLEFFLQHCETIT